MSQTAEAQISIKERPVIFQAESVRAVFAGKKIQTRRVMKPQPMESTTTNYQTGKVTRYGWTWQKDEKAEILTLHHPRILECCPYGKIGDRLWVRETFLAHQS